MIYFDSLLFVREVIIILVSYFGRGTLLVNLVLCSSFEKILRYIEWIYKINNIVFFILVYIFFI